MSKKTKPSKTNVRSAAGKRRTRMIALEPRMLFDGALGLDLGTKATAAVLGDTSATAGDVNVTPATPEAPAAPAAPKDSSTAVVAAAQTAQSASDTPAEKDAVQKPGAEALDATSKPAEPKEIVFVDSRVKDYQSQLAGVDPKATIVFLDASKDGVTQIADAMANYSDVTAVHIIAQGSADQLLLGDGTLDAASMSGLNAQRIASISEHITADAKILVHGAQFGTGDAGGAAADRLALLTSADVADVASDGTIEKVGIPARQEIVFVDPNVADFQKLVDGIDNPNARIVLLDDTRDGVQQMLDVVKQYQRVDAIHIISHGSEGQIDLAAGALNATTMSGEYSAQLAEIGKHLSADADVLVYGCNFGKGTDGAAAADQFARLTGADVAASVDDTGDAALGGNWNLEVKTGSIESSIAVDRVSQESYHDVLALHTLDFDTAPTWTAGASNMTYTVDGYPVKISVSPATSGDPVQSSSYSGGQAPAQNALQFTLGATGSNTITIDFTGQPGGIVSNVGFALWDVDNTEQAVFSATLQDGSVISPTQLANSAFNSITAGTPGTGTSVTVRGTGSDSTAGQANGNVFVYFNRNDIKSVSFTYTGTANTTLVVLNDITFMGNQLNPPVVDLDASTGVIGTAADTFPSAAYTGTTGTIPWAGAWTETDSTGGGATGGQVQVIDTPAAGTNYALRLNNSSASAFTGAQRAIDLSSYSSLVLSYNYMTSTGLAASDQVVLELSTNGGANWTMLKSYGGSSSGAATNTYTADSVNLAGYESANTVIRFRVSGTGAFTGAAEYFYVDDVQITAQDTSSSNSYTEGDATGVRIAATANSLITDPDSTNMASVKVEINNVAAGDVLTWTNAGSVTGAYNSATGILQLTGVDSKANYQTVINSIRYLNTGDDPTLGGTRPTVTVGVTATDSGFSEGSTATSTITLTSINDAPTLTATASNPTFQEAAGLGTQAAAVSVFSGAAVSTVESGQTITELDFNVSGIVDGANERIRVDGTTITLGANSSGTTATNGMAYAVTISGGTATVVLTKAAGVSATNTQTLINGITYQDTIVDNPTPGNRVFTLTQIKDSGGTASGGVDTTALSIASTVNVVEVNDAPAGTNKTFTIPNNATYTLTAADFGFSDVDINNFASVVITTVPGGTALVKDNGVTVTAGTVVTIADINAGKLQYIADAGNQTFTFQVRDDGGTASGGQNTDQSANTFTFNTTAPANTAPVWNAVASNFTGITEAQTANAGQLVSSFMGTITDPDAGAVGGIAITAAAQANGTWQYSVDGGTTWSAVGAVANNSALLLRPTDMVRFAPNGFGSTSSITYRAWDETSGLTGSKVDTSTNGGTTAFSTTTHSSTINVTDVAPTITSATTASVVEGTSTATVVYTASATDWETVTFSLSGTDAGAFNINSSTGAVTFKAIPDFETKTTYSFNIVASDGTLTSNQAVTVNVTDVAPTISSSTTATVAEGTSTATVVYTAAATDVAGGTVTYSLTGADAASFNINGSTGAVTFVSSPDFETKSSYSINVKASDPSGAFNTQAVTVNVTDVAPTISSATTATVVEGTSTATVVYTAAATDVNGGTVTYSLTGADAASFNVNSSTGAVTFVSSPDFETKSSYSINVKASDPSGAFNTQAVTVNVTDVAPSITSATTATVAEGTSTATVVYTASATDPAGGTVTYSLTGADAASFNINSSTGAVTFVSSPDFETKSSYSINVKASDPSGANNVQAVTINVTDVAPTVTSATTATVAEGTSTATVVYTAAATDVNGGTVTYSLTGADAASFNINSSTGAVTFVSSPDFETKSSYSINVKASDPSGAFNTQAVTVNVTDVAPAISSGAAGSVTEGAAAGTTVYTAAASDVQGGTVTYSLTGADAGSFTINSSTGVVTINAIPDYETKSSYSFNVKAADPSGAFSTKAVTVNVTDVAPTISSSTTATVAEGTSTATVVYTAAATDVAGGTVTYSLTGADAASFNINSSTGAVTFVSSPDFETKSSYSINVKASDPSGAFNTQAVTVNVTDVAPTISSATTATVVEGTSTATVVYTAAATDVNGGTVTYSLTGADAASFNINSSTGAVTFVSSPDFETKSSYSINIKASDPSGANNVQAVTINVTDVAPTVTSATTATVAEGTSTATVVYTASATDPAGGTVTYSLTGADAASFNINSSTGAVTFVSSPDFETKSSYSINVKASDPSGAFNTQAVTVNVTDVAPTISSATTATVVEGTSTATVVYTAAATDVNGGTVTYSLTGADAASFNINSSTGAVTFVSSPDFETKSSYSINVKASDPSGAFNTQAVTVNVTDVAPSITSATTATVAEGTSTATVVYTASATDPVGGAVTYSLTGADAAAFTINSSTGAVTFVASPDYETKSSYSINVKAADASGAFNTQAVTVNVTDVAPTISSATTATVVEGTSTATVVYTAAATDVNGGTVTYSLTGADAASFSINSSTGAVTFVSSPDFETKSSYSINIKASDPSGANNVQAVTVNVTDVAPTVTSATTATVVEGTSTATVVYTAAATDVNGGTVTYSLTGADAASFNINSSTGAVTFVSSPDFETKSSYSINVKASDPSGAFNTQAVTINVTDVAPTISSSTTATVAEGTATATVVYTAAATDVNGGTVTYSLTGADAASFNINSSTGAVTFASSPDFETKSSYSINVKASDPSGAFNTQAVTVNVTDVAPSITSATTATVAEGTSTATVVYTASATDPVGGTVTYSLTGADAASFNINSSTGAVTFVSSPDFETKSSYSINVKASDPSGAFNTQAVTVNVTDVAPSITSATTATVAEGTSTATVVYTASATDPAGGTVTYSLTGTDAASFNINSSTGAVTFVSSPDFETKSSYSINIKASDPSGANNVQAVTINVTDVAPTISSATTATVAEGTSTATVVYTAAATDVNGGTVTYSLTGADAASFNINSATGAVTFVSSPDFETKSSYSINVKASDPSGANNVQAVTINVTDVAPTISSATTATVVEGTSTATVVYTASATDPAGGTVTYSLTGADAASFNINSSTGAVTFVSSPDFETKSSYSINIKASDPSGANNVQAVTVNVTDVAPTISSATTATVVEGTSTATVVYTASAADPAGGTVTYSLTGADAAAFTINSSTGAVTFVASPDYETKSSYSVNVKASDASGAFNTQAVTVSVTDVAPSITSATTATVAEGTSTATVVYTASATDPAGGTVTYALTGADAAAFNINSSTGAVTFVSSPDFETKSSYSINVKASDPSGANNLQAVTLNVTDVAPSITSATTATVAEGTSTATVVYTASATDPVGGAVTYSLTGADAAAFTINSATGAVTFNAVPDYETKSSYSINVKASDPSGANNVQAVTINVTDVAPTITSSTTATVAEGTSTATVVYTASATDIAGGTVTYSLTGADAAAFTINSSTGAVTFVSSPDFETKSSYSINVKASDPSGAFNTQAVTVNVTDVAPSITSATTATVAEGTSTATVVYTASATDPVGGTVTYSLTGADAASFNINSSTGAVTFVSSPDFETKSSYSINVKASDPSGAFNTQAVTVNVTDVAPSITSATTATVAEGTSTATVVYTASATDPAGGTVTYSLTGTDAASFNINSSTGAVTFVSSPDFETKSSYSINIKASDPSGANNVQAVTINVTDVAPTISSATTATVAEGTSTATVVYTAAATDVNGGTVTYSLTGADAASFNINSATGAVTFVSSPDFETKSSYSINVKASDPSGANNVQAVTINVTDVAPTISSATTATVVEGTSTATVVYTASATDPAGGTVTYSLTGADAASFNINSSTGAVTFVSSPDFETKSSYSINIKASDPSGANNVQAVTVNVTDVAPTISSATTATVVEGTSTATVVYTAAATDVNGGTVTYSLTGADAASFNINSSTGAVTFVSSPDFETKSSYSINIKASDPSGANNTQAVTINVTDVAPTISSATTATVAEGTSTATVVYTAAATDVNGGTVTYSLTGADAASFNINSSTGAVTFVSSPDFETKSSYSINVKASDPSGAFNTQALTVNVTDVAPSITSATTATVAEGTSTATVVYTASATDPAGGTVTYSLTGADAASFNINSSTGAVTFVSSPDFETKSSYSINVKASDPSGANNVQAVTINVTDVAPTVTSATTATVAEGTSTATVVYTAAATDVNGGTVTYSLTGADAASFNINSSTGAVTFVSSPDFETKSSYSINVKASDPSGAFNTQAVTVNVTDVAPTISSGAAGSVTEGAAAGTTVYTAAASDVQGGTVTYALTGADAGSFTINSSTGVVTINAIPDYETKSSYSINVKASDPSGANNVQAVTINVTDVAPTISSSTTATVAEGTSTATVVYTASATDVAGGTVTYSLTGADAAAFNINSSTGAVTFVSSPDFETKISYSINVKASDPSGAFNTQAVTVNVTDVAPTISSSTTATVAEGTSTATVVYTAAATDVNGGTVTYSLTGADAASFNINSSTGAVTFASSPDFETKSSYSINVKAADPSGAFNTQAVTVNVTDVAPTISSSTTATVAEGTSTATVVYTAAATDVNGGTVTYSLTGADAASFNINSSTGAVTFVSSPDFETKSSYSINVKASDPSGANNVQAVTINVTDVAPTVTSATTATVAEGTSTATVVYTAAATDVNGGTVTYSLTGADAASFNINSSTGAVTFVSSPDFETKSSYSINVKASDPSGAFNTQAVTVNVTDVAPSITSATTATVAEGTSTATVVYTAAGTDVNGGTVTYSLTGTDAASFNINSSTGAVTFVSSPDFETKSSYSINIKASDPSGANNVQAVTINITNVNEAPSGTNATVAILENTTYTFAASDFGFSDPDAGDVMTAVRIDSIPAAGTLTLAGFGPVAAGQVVSRADVDAGKLQFTPGLNGNGAGYASVAFSVSDGALFDVAPNAINIDVGWVNHAPTITSGTAVAVPEGIATTAVVYTGTATDLDVGDTISWSLTGADAGAFTINAATGAVTFNASPDFETKSAYSFNVVASDGTITSSQAVTVSVTDVAPSITSATSVSVPEGTSTATVVYTAAATDVQGGAVSFNLTGADAAAFTINAATGAVTFNASPDYETKSAYSFNVVASDGTLTSSQAVTVSVSDVAPAITSATSVSVPEGTSTATVVYTAAANDVQGGTVTFNLSGADAGAFTINAATGAVTFNASPNFETKSAYSFNVVASDGTLTSSQAVTVSVTDVAPSITSATTVSVAEGTSTATVVYTAAATDVQGGAVSFSLSGADAAAFTVNAATGAVRFNASPDFETKSAYSFNVVASDGTLTSSQAVTVSVTDVAPSITSATSVSVPEGTSTATVVYTAAATDVQGGAVTFNLTGADAAAFTINAATGAVTFNASPDYETKSSYSFNVVASDGTLTSSQAVTVSVSDVAPTITSATTVSVPEGTSTATVVYTASATDVQGGAVTFNLSGADAGAFSINPVTGQVSFNASPDFETKSSYTFNVVASDGTLTSSQAITVSVTDVAPTITSATAVSVSEGTSTATVVYTAAANDVQGGAVSFSLSGADAAAFTVNAATGAVRFNASPDFETKSAYSFNVVASDGTLTSSQAVTVSVTDVAPSITSATSVSVPEGTSTAAVVYTAAASDPAGGAVTFNLSGADAAAFTINAATGAVTFNASPDYETKSAYSFNVVASDGTLTSSQAVSVAITDVAPAITSSTSVSVPEGTSTATVVYTASATDVQGGAVSFSLSGADAGAFTINAATGAVTFNASPNFETKSGYAFNVVASDGTASTSQAVTVSVTDIAPTITSATTVSVPEGTNTATVVYTAAANDVQGGAVSFSLSGADAAAFTVNAATGAVRFNASPDFETKSAYTFNVVASDGTLSSSQAVTVSVTDVAPTITSATAVSVAEGTSTATVVYTAAATDVQGGAVSFSLTGADAAAFTINAATGAVTFNASPDFETKSAYSFNVVASDGTITSSQAVTVSVTDVAPSITSATSVSVPEGTSTATVVYTAAATDVQGGAVSFNLTGADAAAFTINAATGAVTFNASPDYETKSAYSFNVVASDGTLTSSQAVTVSVSDVAPAITSATSVSVPEGTSTATVVYTAAANDVQGGTVTFNLSGADAGAFTINAATGAVTFNASPNFETKSAYSFNVVASDGTLTSSQAVTVSVTDVAPSITSATTVSVAEGTSTATVVYTAAATDVQGGAVSFSLSGADAAAFTVNAATGAVRFNASPDFETKSAYSFNVVASDGTLTSSQAVTVSVTDVAPSITSATSVSVPEGTSTATVVYTAAATDVQGGAVTFNLTGADAAAFTINAATGAVTFNASPDYETKSSYSFNVVASDGTLTSSQAVTVSVSDVAPTITSATTVSVPEGTSTATVVYTASATDVQGGAVTFNLSGADAGAFSINPVTGQVSFNASPDFETKSSYTFNVVASDGTTASNQAVTVSITNVNEAPVVTSPATASFAENTTGAVYGAASADQDAGDTVVWTLSGPDAGLFAVNPATGVVTVLASHNVAAPGDANADGIYDLILTATDSGGLASSKNVHLNLTAATTPAPAQVPSQPVTPQVEEVTLPATPISAAAPAAGAPSPAAIPPVGTPVSAPAFDLIALGQPVDGTVGRSSLGSSAGAPASIAERALSLPDLNALPATAAGPEDLSGFPVQRMTLAEAIRASDTGVGFVLGGQRLFVYHGIPDMQLLSDGSGSVRIPQDAFAHTDPAAIVRLEARFTNGLPLPSWLKFEGTGGTFRGLPPEGLQGFLDIEVIARDNDGREAHTGFKLELADLQAADGRAADLPDLSLGLDVDAKEREKARIEAARQAGKAKTGPEAKPGKQPAASFTDQVRVAKGPRDPLLDRITGSGAEPPRGRR